MGEVVGFLDRSQQQRNGRITRLNDKTVTLITAVRLNEWSNDITQAETLIEGMFYVGAVVADKAFDADSLLERIEEKMA